MAKTIIPRACDKAGHRDYRAEFERRREIARAAGFKSYWAYRQAKGWPLNRRPKAAV